MHNIKMASIAMAALVTGSSLGCGDSGPEGTAPVRLNFQSGSSSFQASVAEQPRFSVSGPSGINGLAVTGTNGNTMDITLVRMTLEDIDLERTDQSIDCATTTSGSFEDCSDYFAGPLLVELDLSGGGSGFISPLTLDAPYGMFDIISFDISVPDGGDPAQEAYLSMLSDEGKDMTDVSIRIIGTHLTSGSFDFELDLRGDQELMISLDVSEGNNAVLQITVTFDVAAWFVRADGTLIDPNSVCALTLSCADRSRIEETIELSIIAGL